MSITLKGYNITLAENGYYTIEGHKDLSISNRSALFTVVEQLERNKRDVAEARSKRKPGEKPVKPVFDGKLWVAAGVGEWEPVEVVSASGTSAYRLRVWYRTDSDAKTEQSSGSRFVQFRDQDHCDEYTQLTKFLRAANNRVNDLVVEYGVRPGVRASGGHVFFLRPGRLGDDGQVTFHPVLDNDLFIREPELLPGEKFISYYDLGVRIVQVLAPRAGYTQHNGIWIETAQYVEFLAATSAAASAQARQTEVGKDIHNNAREALRAYATELADYRTELEDWKAGR